MKIVLPVTTLGQDQMALRNALTPIEMLSSLPQVTGSPANESPRGGAGARGDIATVTMRGLSASDTLVLLNGRRIIAHPPRTRFSTHPTSINCHLRVSLVSRSCAMAPRPSMAPMRWRVSSTTSPPAISKGTQGSVRLGGNRARRRRASKSR